MEKKILSDGWRMRRLNEAKEAAEEMPGWQDAVVQGSVYQIG